MDLWGVMPEHVLSKPWRTSGLTSAALLLVICLVGCAKTGSSPAISLSEPTILNQPTQLVVIVTNDLPSPVAGPIPPLVDTVLAQEFADQLASPGIQVSVRQSLAFDGTPTANALLIRCSVDQLRVGNQALRMAVGFGAGQFTIATRTTVTDLRGPSATDLVSFQSHSTTGSMPGPGLGLLVAAGSGQVIGMVGGGAGLLLDARQTASQRARQLADSVSGQLRAYFQAEGWTKLSTAPRANSALGSRALLAPPQPLPPS